MLRIHFTDRDLARVSVGNVDPLWETVLGVQQLTATHRRAPVFAAWRERARVEVVQRRLVVPLRMVRTLAPEDSGYFPDFLTPAEAEGGMDAGLEALLATPAGRLAAETARLSPPSGAPVWLRALAAGDRQQLPELGKAMRELYSAIIRPDWARAAEGVDADRMLRATALRDGGVHGLLDSLRPALRWDPPVLSTRYPEDRDLYLDGRGIRLVPSHFCWYLPVAMADPELPPVLVYPITHNPEWARPARGQRERALGALLGRTRTQVLRAASTPSSTTEIAHRLRISPASASAHATTLREAGLITSSRQGNQVIHALAPLGAAVLAGELRPRSP